MAIKWKVIHLRVSNVVAVSLVMLMIPWMNITAGIEEDLSRTTVLAPVRASPVTFTNVSEEIGLSGVNGNHFSWGDFDRDGHEDLLVDGKRLFQNSGPPFYTFSEVTSHAGIASSVNTGVWGDIDNDGWLDIFCGGGSGSRDHPTYPDILWHNRKDGTFERIMPEDGAPWDTFTTVAAGWADLDRDGYLDIYMVNYENKSMVRYPDHFWTNNGDGTFSNATVTSGMSENDHAYPGRGVSWCDYDEDGFIDAYVSNYRITPNYLYHNLGDGTMEEIAATSGVEGHGNDHPVSREGPYFGHSLGSSWGDLDNDGDMDLWVTNLAHKDAWRGPICDDSYLFENLGEEQEWTFVDRREGSGIAVKDIPGALSDGDELMVSSAMADYDNDGDLDLFIPQIYRNLDYAYSYLYRNDGDLTFTDVSGEAGIKVWDTYGSAWCDYNEDGWIDLVTGGGVWDPDQDPGLTTNHAVHLYRNDGGSSHWLEVELEGRTSNSPAIGARVEVRVDREGDGTFDLLCVREIQGGTAAQGQQDSMVLHFGLGDRVSNMEVSVHWPMGWKVVESNISVDTRVRFFEPTDRVDLEMEIIGFEPSGSGSSINFQFSNPSDQFILLQGNELQFKGSEEDETVILDIGGLVPPGDSMRSIRTIDWGEDEPVNISYRVSRTFPPVKKAPNGSYYHDPGRNLLPIPILEGPLEGEAGQELEFSASSSYDPDGEVSGYLFDMGDGRTKGWTQRTMVEHVYGVPGTYTVRLSVQDDRGDVSVEDALLNVQITGEGPVPPRARIISVTPDEPFIGEDVEFEGEGMPGLGKSIVEHEWSSSLDGYLSDEPSFEADDLSEGMHSILYRVKDSGGTWSEPDEVDLKVSPRYMEPLWVEMDPPVMEGPFSGIIEITGTTGPLFLAERVEVRIDSGLWDNVWMVPDWKFRLDCSELDEGSHWLEVRAYGNNEYSDSYAILQFEVEHPKEEERVDNEQGSTGLELRPELLLIGISLVSIATIVVLIMVMVPRRRRRLDEFLGEGEEANH